MYFILNKSGKSSSVIYKYLENNYTPQLVSLWYNANIPNYIWLRSVTIFELHIFSDRQLKTIALIF